jgi:hypothetical protein
MSTNLGPGGTQKPSSSSLYPDTPWWSNLITAALTAVVCILGTAYALRDPTKKSGIEGIPPAAAIVSDTIMYIPHILLLFGVLADMFTYQGVWSIPSLVGLLSIFFNYLMQYFWKGLRELFDSAKKVADSGAATDTAATAPPVSTSSDPTSGRGRVKKGGDRINPPAFFKNYDGCSVQGFSGFATEFAPQTLVVTATVFCYYIFDLVRNRGWLNSAASIVMFGVFYVMQVGVLMMTGDCPVPSTSGSPGYSSTQQAAMAFFEGLVFGGSAYGIVQTYYPSRLVSSVISPFPTRSKADLTMGPDGNMYDSDGNPYVILPNGQAVPNLSTANSRKAFAELAGKNLGTGLPAKPACPS